MHAGHETGSSFWKTRFHVDRIKSKGVLGCRGLRESGFRLGITLLFLVEPTVRTGHPEAAQNWDNPNPYENRRNAVLSPNENSISFHHRCSVTIMKHNVIDGIQESRWES